MVQSIAKPAGNGVIAVIAEVFQWEKTQSGQGVIVKQDGSTVFLLEVFKVGADPLPVCTDGCSFPVSLIFGKIVSQDALTIYLNRIVDRVPVPEHDTVGAVCNVAEGVKPELARIWKPCDISLSLCL